MSIMSLIESMRRPDRVLTPYRLMRRYTGPSCPVPVITGQTLKYWPDIHGLPKEEKTTLGTYSILINWRGMDQANNYALMAANEVMAKRKPMKVHRFFWARHVCAEYNVRLIR